MTDPNLTIWRKSSRSSAGANCVEVADADGGSVVGVRDSKDRTGGTLVFSRGSWIRFISKARNGGFNLP